MRIHFDESNLLAEVAGKRNGIFPKVTGLAAFDALAGEPLAKLIDAERRATAAAMVANGRPNCTVTLGRVDEEHLGAFLQMMEFETAFLGGLLDIKMGRTGYDEYRKQYAEYEAKRKYAIA